MTHHFNQKPKIGIRLSIVSGILECKILKSRIKAACDKAERLGNEHENLQAMLDASDADLIELINVKLSGNMK